MDAVSAAQRRFRLSANPRGSWSIAVVARLHEAPDPELIQRRASALSASEPSLGPAPVALSVAPDQLDAVTKEFCVNPYRAGGPAMRVATAGDALLAAVHHGAADGIGLLGALGSLVGAEITSSSRGLRPLGAYSRGPTGLATKLMHPSARPRRTSGDSEQFASRTLDGSARRVHTWVAATCAALAPRLETGKAPIRIAVGASQRQGTDPTIADRSAFIEIEPTAPFRSADIATLVRTTAPRTVTDTRGLRLPHVLTAPLGARMGPTALVSSLGNISGHGGLVSGISFYPVAYGRSGLALGVASVEGLTTLSLRSANSRLGRGELEDILDEIVRHHRVADP